MPKERQKWSPETLITLQDVAESRGKRLYQLLRFLDRPSHEDSTSASSSSSASAQSADVFAEESDSEPIRDDLDPMQQQQKSSCSFQVGFDFPAYDTFEARQEEFGRDSAISLGADRIEVNDISQSKTMRSDDLALDNLSESISQYQDHAAIKATSSMSSEWASIGTQYNPLLPQYQQDLRPELASWSNPMDTDSFSYGCSDLFCSIDPSHDVEQHEVSLTSKLLPETKSVCMFIYT